MDAIRLEVNNMLTRHTFRELIRHGLRLHPLTRTFTPTAKGWQAAATSDPTTAKGWFDTLVLDGVEHPPCHASALVLTGAPLPGGGYLLVLDVDVKDGKDGRTSLLQHTCLEGDLPDGPVVRTPSGGLHYYFRAPKRYRQSIGKLGVGLDIKCAGGYVVAPGAQKPAGVYRWEVGLSPDREPIPDLPEWLEAWLDENSPPEDVAAERKARNAEAYTDAPEDVAAGIDLLRRTPPAIQGSGGDAWTVRTAAKLHDLGLSEPVAWRMMLLGSADGEAAEDDAWNSRCEPPWEPEALYAKIASAYKSAQNTAGCASHAELTSGFPQEPLVDRRLPPSIEDIFTKPEPPKRRLARRPFREARFFDADEVHLIEDVLEEGAVSVIYGQSNSGKSFFALDMAYAVATGRPFFGRETNAGPVLYIAAEGGGGLSRRLAALHAHYGDDDPPFDIVASSVDLLRHGADTQEIVLLTEDAAAEWRAPVKLIVIDTLSRAMAGGNENSPEDMTALVKNVDRIRAETGAHVCLIHHSGKDDARGARGHSSLRAAVDTELEVSVGEDGKSRVMTVKKQRDMEYGAPIPFWLEGVTLGENRRGKRITSCTITDTPPVSAGGHAGKDFPVALTAAQSEALDALVEAEESIRGDTDDAPGSAVRPVSVYPAAWFVTWGRRKGLTEATCDLSDETAVFKIRRGMLGGERNGTLVKTMDRLKKSLIECGAVLHLPDGGYRTAGKSGGEGAA